VGGNRHGSQQGHLGIGEGNWGVLRKNPLTMRRLEGPGKTGAWIALKAEIRGEVWERTLQ